MGKEERRERAGDSLSPIGYSLFPCEKNWEVKKEKMKKVISVGMIGIIVSAMLLASLPATSAQLHGDANGDGVVDILDLTFTARIICGLEKDTDLADANCDGATNVLDMARIGLIILKKAPAGKLTLICTTTLLGNFAEEIGGDRIDVTSIVPAGMCPGHYDVKPSAILAVSKALLVFRHGFEGYFSWFDDMIEASGNKGVRIVDFSGEWNIPPLAVEKVKKISKELCEIDPCNATYFSGNENNICESINETARQIKDEADQLNAGDVKVICMEWQEGFVNWTGFNIVATYPPPERLSVADIIELTNKGREENVTLVIDNLQSGTDFGAGLASDVGATQVILTNFPGAIPGTETYSKMIEYNARQLFDAIPKAA